MFDVLCSKFDVGFGYQLSVISYQELGNSYQWISYQEIRNQDSVGQEPVIIYQWIGDQSVNNRHCERSAAVSWFGSGIGSSGN